MSLILQAIKSMFRGVYNAIEASRTCWEETKEIIELAIKNPEEASVGQTIVVKEVDANGKPTAWESADYQPRTHWDDGDIEVLPETTVEVDQTTGISAELLTSFVPIVNETYKVKWDGVEYSCVGAFLLHNDATGVALGNYRFASTSYADTGEPFMLFFPAGEDGALVLVERGTVSATLSIKEANVAKIPPKYLPNGIGYDGEGVIVPETTLEIDPESMEGMLETSFVPYKDKTYTVKYNGVDYNCVGTYLAMPNEEENPDDPDNPIVTIQYMPALGNVGALTGEGDTGEPFLIGSMSGYCGVLALDGSTSVTFSIIGEKPFTIPDRYIDHNVVFVDILNKGDNLDQFPIELSMMPSTIINLIDAGKTVILRHNVSNSGSITDYRFASEESGYYKFVCFFEGFGDWRIRQITIYDDDVSYEEHKIQLAT